jgi:hypothetical protein
MGLFKKISKCKHDKGFLFCGECRQAFRCDLLERMGKELAEGKIILMNRC